MEHMPLIFRGHRWPAAQVDKGIATTTGDGRLWSERAPRGFWRSFSEVDCDNDAAVAGWLQRYGDPKSVLTTDHPVDISGWPLLAGVLTVFGRGWGERDRNGIALVREDANLQAQADLIMRHVDIRFVIEPNLTPAAYCDRLQDYLIGSATFMLVRKVPMRRCDHCQHWFGLQRRTARFCSDECRSAASRARKDQSDVLSS